MAGFGFGVGAGEHDIVPLALPHGGIESAGFSSVSPVKARIGHA